MVEMTFMELEPEERFITARELQGAFRISRSTLNRWLSRGLPMHQPGGEHTRMYFNPREVADWIKRDCWDASTPGEDTDAEAAA